MRKLSFEEATRLSLDGRNSLETYKRNYDFLAELLQHREKRIEEIIESIVRRGIIKPERKIEEYRTIHEQALVVLKLMREQSFSHDRFSYTERREKMFDENCRRFNRELDLTPDTMADFGYHYGE